MKNKNFIYLCVMLLLLKITGGKAQCATFCNGDFDNTFVTNSNAIVPANLVSCWQTTAADGKIEVWYNGYVGVLSYSGNQFVELNANYVSTLYQDFVVVPGNVLTISFAHRGRSGTDVMGVEIGPSTGPFVSLVTCTDGQAWQFYSGINYTIPTGQGTSFRIRFVSISAAGNKPNIGNFLDAVTVTQSPCLFNLSANVTQATCSTPNAVTIVPSNPNLNYTYNWSPGGYTSSSVSNIPPGIYNITVSAACGCSTVIPQHVVQVTVNPTPTQPIPLTVADVTLCANAATSTLISASSSLPGPVTYFWSGPNINSPNPAASINVNPPLVPGAVYIYTVSATSPAGCPNSATLAVTITTNCCSQSTTGLTALTGQLNGTYPPGSYLLANDIQLGTNTVFQDAEIRIMPGRKITVPAGMSLGLQHAHLYACGSIMWQGIVLNDKGSIYTTDPGSGSNLIEDAVVAIDASGLSPTSSQNLIILSIFDATFNKNYIGIQMSNAIAGLNNLPISIYRSVFTSRDMSFSNTGPFVASSWPNVYTTGGLRAPFSSNATQGLLSPYPLSPYLPSNLKADHHNPQLFGSQPGETGIKIVNVGSAGNGLPTIGVNINITSASYNNGTNDFNLFDGIHTGIDVQDASLTTKNNVFQNLITGVKHNVTGLMNAGLDLRSDPYFPSGNKFWNCWVGVQTQNVFDVKIDSGLFRSSRNLSMGTSIGPGSNGILLSSNRFKYNIQKCEFNNIDNGISIDAQYAPYDVAGNSNFAGGTYADAITINQNYFGMEVTSITSPGSEHLGNAITLKGVNANNWQQIGVCNIFSNKIDRAYRGIQVNTMNDYPIEIGGNSILLQNDLINSGSDQYGIFACYSKGNLVIKQNTVTGPGVSNAHVKLIRCTSNLANSNGQSPAVTKNEVSSADIGFAFEGKQPSTKWECNNLYTPMNFGLSLEVDPSNGNPGEIGQQGNPCLESGNEYRYTNNWVPPNVYTKCDAPSNPASSVLYVAIFIPYTPLPTHAGTNPYTSTEFVTFFNCSAGNDCLGATVYPALPSQRTASPLATKIDKNAAPDLDVEVYPNPTTGNIIVRSTTEDDVLAVKITDLTGKTVYTKNIVGSASLDISSLKASIYFIEIQNKNNQTLRKKLVKLD